MQVTICVLNLGFRDIGANPNHSAVAITIDAVAGDASYLNLGDKPAITYKAQMRTKGRLNLLQAAILSVQLSASVVASHHDVLIGIIQKQATLTPARRSISSTPVSLGLAQVAQAHLAKKQRIAGEHHAECPLPTPGSTLCKGGLPAPLSNQIVGQFQYLSTSREGSREKGILKTIAIDENPISPWPGHPMPAKIVGPARSQCRRALRIQMVVGQRHLAVSNDITAHDGTKTDDEVAREHRDPRPCSQFNEQVFCSAMTEVVYWPTVHHKGFSYIAY